MASVKGTGNFVEFDEYVEYQLEKVRQGVKWADILTACVGVAVLLLVYLLLFVVADHWIFEGGVPRGVRIVALCLVGAISAVWLAVKAVWPLWRRVNDLYAARMLEQSEPDLRGHLLGLIDARRAGRLPAEQVRRALEKHSATTLSEMDVDAALDRRALMRALYLLLGIVVIVCAYVVFSPKRIGPSLLRAMAPGSSVSVATRTEILDLRPGDTHVLAGSQVDVSVRLRGETPEQVWLFYSTADQRFVDEPVEMRLSDEATREYRATLMGDAGQGLTQDVTYRVEAGDEATDTYTVQVGRPPTATIETISLDFPDYTQQPTEKLSQPPIEAVEGTQVTLRAEANRPLERAKLVFADDPSFRQHGEEIPAEISEDGLTVTATWPLAIRSDGSAPSYFRIDPVDRQGQSNPHPAVFPIKIVPDAPPEISLRDPAGDLERPANAVIPLLVAARDPDYALSQITLHIEKDGESLPGRTVLWEGEESSVNLRHEWPLEPLGLEPGDELALYLQARDNRQPDANARNTSPLIHIRITEPVSQEQVKEQLAEDIAQQEQEKDKAAKASRPEEGESPETPPADVEKKTEQPPEGERGEGEKGEKSPNGDEPQKGKEQSESDSPVKNDGSQDDRVLREVLEQQRRERSQQKNGDKKNDDNQAPGQESNQGKQGGGEKKQDGAGQKQGGTGQSGEGASQNGEKQSGSQGQGQREGQGDGQKAGGANGSSDSPASETGGTGPADGNRPAGSPGDSQPGNANNGDESPGASSEDRGEGDGGDGDSSPDDRSMKDGSDGKSGKGDSGEGATDESDGSGAGELSQDAPQDGASADSKRDGGDAQEDSPENTSPGAKSDDGTPAGKSENSQKSATGDDSSAASDESKRGKLDPSQKGDSIESAPGESGERPSDQPPREEMPAGDNPNPGDGTKNQRAKRPEAGEEGAGQPNSAGTPEATPGQGEQTSADGPGNKPGTKGEQGQGGSQGDQQKDAKKQSEEGAGGSTGKRTDPNSPMEDTSPSTGSDGSKGEESAAGEPSQGSPSGTGEDQSGQDKTGQSGQSQSGESQSGEGSSGQGKSSGQNGEGQNQSQSSESGGQSGQGQNGQGKSGQGQSGQGSSGQSSGGAGTNSTGGSGAGNPGNGLTELPEQRSPNQAPSQDDPAEQDFSRETANLVLKRLEEDLDRGEVDPELLEELGWTSEDMEKFANRLRSNLSDPGEEASPQQRAQRREFQHMLENMNFQGGSSRRQGQTDRVRDVEGVGEIAPTVPSAYREAYERFTRSVSGFGEGETGGGGDGGR